MEPLFSLRSRGPIFSLLVSMLVPRVMAINWSPPAALHTGERHMYNRVLPGAPRGSFRTLAINHPSATQHSARCITLWLRWLVLSEVTLTRLQDPKCTLEGYPRWQTGVRSLLPYGYDQARPQENVVLIPTPPHGMVRPFYNVEPGGLRHHYGTLGRQLK
jgi:hypothetical protein